MNEAEVSYLENPYHEEFHWQVDFGGVAKQWFKTKEEAEKSAKTWNESIEDQGEDSREK